MQHHISKCNFLFFNSFSRPSYRKISHKKIWRVQRCRIALKTQTFYVYTYTHIHMHNNTFTQTRIHTHSYTLIHTHTHTGGMKHHSVCENQERYICMCIYTHTHTHTHTPPLSFLPFFSFFFRLPQTEIFFQYFRFCPSGRCRNSLNFSCRVAAAAIRAKHPVATNLSTHRNWVFWSSSGCHNSKKKKKRSLVVTLWRAANVYSHTHMDRHIHRHTHSDTYTCSLP